MRLSTKVGVSHQSIACYETNQRIPSLPVAYKILKP
ncbi:MAG: helix-turn-helix transcriptional regulator [Firmicutes bacterium]|nr:helix-turn-helix transcriptional regulator [Bacillota bacterium]